MRAGLAGYAAWDPCPRYGLPQAPAHILVHVPCDKVRVHLREPFDWSTTERILTTSFRGLVLWEADPTLVVGLEAAKTFAKRTEYLMMFWPSECTSSCSLLSRRIQFKRFCVIASSTARVDGSSHAARAGVSKVRHSAAQHLHSEAFPADEREELEELRGRDRACVAFVVPCIITHPMMLSVLPRWTSSMSGVALDFRAPTRVSVISETLVFRGEVPSSPNFQACLPGACICYVAPGVCINVIDASSVAERRLTGSGSCDLDPTRTRFVLLMIHVACRPELAPPALRTPA